MKAWIAIVLFFGITGTASAEISSDGREEALQICQALPFQTSVRECMGIVQQSRYFDQRVLPVCAAFQFDSRKLECLRVISNKTYLEGEISICSNIQFDTQKIDCFKTSGQTYLPGGNVDVAYLRREVRFAIESLRRGSYPSADRTLIEVLNYLDRH
jgi:hypothetical protein